jgi:ATP-binding cassette subfamily F protein uup
MDHLLSTQNICHSFGAHALFTNISLNFNEKCRIGLIGPNGSGKSTFLQIISEQLQPDSGKLFKKKNVRIVYISQHDNFDETQTVEDLVTGYAHGVDATERLSITRKHLSAAQFTDTTVPVATLSGGWKKKVSIVCGLVQNPDLLLLDEPTNHLDIATIVWLEQLLKQAKFGFIIVSHDRQFLENIAKEVIEINQCYPEGCIRFAGNYSNFLKKRSQFLESQQEAETTLANKVRRETAWLRRGPKARATKAKFRIDEAHKMQSDLADLKKLNTSTQQMQAGLMATGRKTKKLFAADAIAKSWDTTPLFKDLSFVLGPGTRLGLVGKNGCGKTSLMHIISGKNHPDSGTVTYADKVKIILFDQKREQLNQNQTLRQALAPEGDSVLYQGRPIHVAGWAKRFLFSPDQLEMPVSHLSGGEQARILIAGFMTREADIILLDEPTNDLDIESIEVLEESLQEFSGAIVLVSHDRAFLNSIATEVVGFNESTHNCRIYGDYEQWLRDTEEKPKLKKGKKQKGPQKQTKAKLTYREEKELETIEDLIQEAEAFLETCKNTVGDFTVMSDPEHISKWCDILASSQEKVDSLYERWDELEEKKRLS